MTGRAPDALCNMNAVVKICVFRQVVNTLPFHRLVIAEAGSDRFEIRAVGPYLAVTVHAGLRWRHARSRCRFDRLVAIPAVDAVVADMMLMAELDWLLPFQITSRQVGRPRDLRISKECETRQNGHPDHSYPGDIICTFIKKFRHF